MCVCVSGAAPLTLAHMWGLTRVEDDSPTTRGRTGGLSKGKPIDHAFINARMRDCAFWGGGGSIMIATYQITSRLILNLATEPFMVTS